jgi:hypothetical protein
MRRREFSGAVRARAAVPCRAFSRSVDAQTHDD